MPASINYFALDPVVFVTETRAGPAARSVQPLEAAGSMPRRRWVPVPVPPCPSGAGPAPPGCQGSGAGWAGGDAPQPRGTRTAPGPERGRCPPPPITGTANYGAASRESSPEVRGSRRRGWGGDTGRGAPARPRRKFGHFPEVVRGKVGERPGDAGIRAAMRVPGPGTGGVSPLTCAAAAPPPALAQRILRAAPAAALRAAAAAPRPRCSAGRREWSGTARPETGAAAPLPASRPPPRRPRPRRRPPPRAQRAPPGAGAAASGGERSRCCRAPGASSLAAARAGPPGAAAFPGVLSPLKFDTFRRHRIVHCLQGSWARSGALRAEPGAALRAPGSRSPGLGPRGSRRNIAPPEGQRPGREERSRARGGGSLCARAAACRLGGTEKGGSSVWMQASCRASPPACSL